MTISLGKEVWLKSFMSLWMYCLCYLIKNNKYIFKRQLGVQIKPAPGFKVRFLARRKETALGASPYLVLYRVSAENPSVNTALGQLQGLSSSISLSFSNPHLLAGAWDWELCCSLAASGSSFSSSSTTGSWSAASSAWGSAASTRVWNPDCCCARKK